MRCSYWLLQLFLLVLLTQFNFGQAHLDTALTYVGVTELTNRNDGVEVEKFLEYVGRRKGDAWCSAFASYVKDAPNTVLEPKVRSGLARHFESRSPDRLVVKSSRVLIGAEKIPKGSFAVWQKDQTVFGHVGLVREDWSGQYGKTVEGNTSSGVRGSQSDGDGVYKRDRAIRLGRRFRIMWFVKFEEKIPYYPLRIEPKPLTTIETLSKYLGITL